LKGAIILFAVLIHRKTNKFLLPLVIARTKEVEDCKNVALNNETPSKVQTKY
jgi:hypothetical protein